MSRSHADVPTPLAARYMAQLCKHFSHKLKTELAESAGSIVFPERGVCTMTADEAALHIVVEAVNDEALPALEHVVASHLKRFAWKEPPEITWVQ